MATPSSHRNRESLDDVPLPCGRSASDLLSRVADARLRGGGAALSIADAHASGCPHCQATARRYDALLARLDAERDMPPEPSESLIGRVLKRVSADVLRSPTWLASRDPSARRPRGILQVRDRVLEQLAREWVLPVVDVRSVDAAFDGDRLRIDVAATYGAALPPLGERIRSVVLANLAECIGPAALTVDVRFVDIRRCA
ncbi:MAG: hypothetical protein ACR2F6_19460 [Mycobacteriales bacterium]